MCSPNSNLFVLVLTDAMNIEDSSVASMEIPNVSNIVHLYLHSCRDKSCWFDLYLLVTLWSYYEPCVAVQEELAHLDGLSLVRSCIQRAVSLLKDTHNSRSMERVRIVLGLLEESRGKSSGKPTYHRIDHFQNNFTAFCIQLHRLHYFCPLY